MSIASAITAAQGRVADCYTAISNKGGTLPATQNLSNMPTAINSIPSGGGSKYGCTLDNLLGDVDANGKLQLPSNTSGDILFSGVEDIADKALMYKFYNNTNLTHGISFVDLTTMSGLFGCQYMFYGCTGITSVSFPELTTISGSYGCYSMFYGCTGLTSASFPKLTTISGYYGFYGMFNGTGLTSVSFPELTTISGSNGCYDMFSNCTGLTSISFQKLTTISGSAGCTGMFRGCTGITSASFPELTTISGSNGCNSVFQGCKGLTSASFPKLTTINSYYGFYGMFNGTGLTSISFPKLSDLTNSYVMYSSFIGCKDITDIYFNALTTTSFGSYTNQFSNMFNGGTTGTAATSGTCTLHFPSNLSSKISSLTGYPSFGGASSRIVLSFDLPATS